VATGTSSVTGSIPSRETAEKETIDLRIDGEPESLQHSRVSDEARSPPVRRDEGHGIEVEVVSYVGDQLDPKEEQGSTNGTMGGSQDGLTERIGQSSLDQVHDLPIQDAVVRAGIKQREERRVKPLRTKPDIDSIRGSASKIGERSGGASSYRADPVAKGSPDPVWSVPDSLNAMNQGNGRQVQRLQAPHHFRQRLGRCHHLSPQQSDPLAARRLGRMPEPC